MREINGTMMQFFHWYNKADGSLWNELKDQAQSLAEAGVTAVWLPPPYKASMGANDVGYAVYDMYDLGEFDQRGTVRTKYGTKDELMAAAEVARKAGLQLYWDVVLNHRMGGDEEEEFLATPYSPDNRHEQIGEQRTIKAHTHFTFPGRGDKYSPLKWHWWHFTAIDTNAHDPDYHAVYLFEDKQFHERVDIERGSYDYLMGCDVDVQHPEVQQDFKDWGNWFHDTLGMDGVRFDAVKHVDAGFFPDWLIHVRKHAGKRVFAVGEYWSPHVDALHHFIEVTNGDVALFDAPLQGNFSTASKSGSDYDMRTIFDHSLVKSDPTLAVTIVANHDTQPLQALEAVVEDWFKPLAYALILLRQDGYPCLFYADYYGAEYTDKGRDGNEHHIVMPSHKFVIDTFLGARRNNAFGDQIDYFDHPNTIGWTRLGTEEHPGGMAVVMTNGEVGNKRMQTSLPNHTFKEVTGQFDHEITTDGEGWAEFPCNEKAVALWLPA